MYNYYSYGRPIACSICGSPGSTKQTCPLNPDSKNPDINKHFLSYPDQSMKKSHSPNPVNVVHKSPSPVKVVHKSPSPVKVVHKSPSPVKVVHKSPSPVKAVSADEIFFNSKSKNYYKLSNFFGGVEACYMKDRFKDVEVQELFNKFENASYDEFIYYLKTLQPEKKVWSKLQLDYWSKKEGPTQIPIKGILSKLVGTAVKDTSTAKKRLEIIKKLTGLSNITVKSNLSDKDKKKLMLECLRKKYKIKEYRDILLSTGDAVLHEKPLRGSGDNWTYPGGDWLGQMLMTIRQEIISGKL